MVRFGIADIVLNDFLAPDNTGKPKPEFTTILMQLDQVRGAQTPHGLDLSGIGFQIGSIVEGNLGQYTTSYLAERPRLQSLLEYRALSTDTQLFDPTSVGVNFITPAARKVLNDLSTTDMLTKGEFTTRMRDVYSGVIAPLTDINTHILNPQTLKQHMLEKRKIQIRAMSDGITGNEVAICEAILKAKVPPRKDEDLNTYNHVSNSFKLQQEMLATSDPLVKALFAKASILMLIDDFDPITRDLRSDLFTPENRKRVINLLGITRSNLHFLPHLTTKLVIDSIRDVNPDLSELMQTYFNFFDNPYYLGDTYLIPRGDRSISLDINRLKLAVALHQDKAPNKDEHKQLTCPAIMAPIQGKAELPKKMNNLIGLAVHTMTKAILADWEVITTTGWL